MNYLVENSFEIIVSNIRYNQVNEKGLIYETIDGRCGSKYGSDDPIGKDCILICEDCY